MGRGHGGSGKANRYQEVIEELASKARVDRVTAEAVDALAEAEIQALLLKGAAHARLLYADGSPRPYRDSDLLIHPQELDAAGVVLAASGFTCLLDERRLGDLAPEAHGQQWHRPEDGAEVDLHWRLPGVGLDPASAWAVLLDNSEELPIAGSWVSTLNAPGRAMHVAIHAAQHGGKPAKAMAELERALQLVPENVWVEAAELAGRLQAGGALSAGLRLTPRGRLLSQRLDLADVPPTWRALVTDPPHGTLPLLRIAATPGTRAKAALLARSLAPSPVYMRAAFPLARKGLVGLASAYVMRVARTVRHLPAAWRAANGHAQGQLNKGQ